MKYTRFRSFAALVALSLALSLGGCAASRPIDPTDQLIALAFEFETHYSMDHVKERLFEYTFPQMSKEEVASFEEWARERYGALFVCHTGTSEERLQLDEAVRLVQVADDPDRSLSEWIQVSVTRVHSTRHRAVYDVGVFFPNGAVGAGYDVTLRYSEGTWQISDITMSWIT